MFKKINFKLCAVVAASMLLAGGAVQAASANPAQPSTEPACWKGVTYNVPFGHIGLFAFLATHPGSTRGACPVVHSDGTIIEFSQPSGVYRCNSGGGIFVLAANQITPAETSTPANVILGVAYAALNGGTQNPLQSGKTVGHLDCAVPAGVNALPGVVADAGGNLYPAALSGTPGLYPVYK